MTKAARGEAQRFYRTVVIGYEGTDCLIWPFARLKGYARLGDKAVSRLICENHNGPAPSTQHQAAHSCNRGQDGCVTRYHVRWATPLENSADQIAHGTRGTGERNPRAKLKRTDVHRIRMAAGTVSQSKMAKFFGVSQATISNVINGKNWSD